MYGIIIGIPQLTLMLLANIETATKSNYGRKFFSAMHTIRKKYTYNHVHEVTLLQIIVKELVGSDGIWVLKDTTALGTETVHLVAKSVSDLQTMIGEDTNSTYTKSAYGMSPNRDSSKEEHKQCACTQEIPTLQVVRQMQKTEEGQGQQAEKEYMPSLQEVPSQKPH
jgi:hypothetical protein